MNTERRRRRRGALEAVGRIRGSHWLPEQSDFREEGLGGEVNRSTLSFSDINSLFSVTRNLRCPEGSALLAGCCRLRDQKWVGSFCRSRMKCNETPTAVHHNRTVLSNYHHAMCVALLFRLETHPAPLCFSQLLSHTWLLCENCQYLQSGREFHLREGEMSLLLNGKMSQFHLRMQTFPFLTRLH